MTMDNLKNWADKNRTTIDDKQPPASEMWEKISGKLDKQSIRKTPRGIFLLRYAAAVAVLFVAGYAFFNQNKAPEGGYALHEISPELAETEFFYASQLEEKMLAIQNSGHEFSTDVFSDIAQLDSIYNDLMKDLNDDADNAEVVEAMIENYRIRLRLLEDILQRIEGNDDDEQNISI